MRFLRIFIVFIITIITSSSILFDWSDYAHIATLKNSGYSVLDRYDEISTTQRTSSYEIAVVSSPALLNENTIEIDSFIPVSNVFHFIKMDIFYPSKIKSYLHLLQLF